MKTKFKNVKKNWIILSIVLLIGVFSMKGLYTKEVTIIEEEKQLKVSVLFSDVESALKKANIQLSDHDKVSKPLKTKVSNGMKIIIERAKPVKLIMSGKEKDIMTANEKVKDILGEYNIVIDENDKVQPTLEETLADNQGIEVIRVYEEIVSDKITIPYKSVIKLSDALDKGKIQVLEKGKNGEKEVKYKVVYENGKEISKDVVEEKILVEAKDEVVQKGTAQYVATARGNVSIRKAVKMTATAYDLSYASCGKSPGDRGYGITRSGTKAGPGVVAVDPRVIPLGTKLYVKSLDGRKDYGFASAEDTGGAIKGNRIDLFYKSPKDVARYGKRKVLVYILK
ncbi:G5 domain-containing protein [Lutibacter sp. B2]|nr:G5 domain-containing protein [Lutibacter sp. B2]